MSKDMNMAFLLDFYKEFLTDKQSDALDLYYNEDMSLAEISEHLGITRQGVRDNIKRGEAVLSELEEKIAIAGRYKNTYDAVAHAIEKIDSVEAYADKSGMMNIVHEMKSTKKLLEGILNGI